MIEHAQALEMVISGMVIGLGDTGKVKDVQQAKQEDCAQRDLLLRFQIQAPDQGHRQAQDHEIDQEISNSVPTKKRALIETFPSDRLVPVKGHWHAFEDCNQHVDDEIEQHDNPCCAEDSAKPSLHAKDTII